MSESKHDPVPPPPPVSDPAPDTPQQLVPKRRRRWLWPLLCIVALLVGAGIGVVGAQADPTTSPEYRQLADARDQAVSSNEQLQSLNSRLQDEVTAAETAVGEIDDRTAALDQRDTEIAARETAVAAREEAVTATELAIEEGTIPGNGIFLVGTDVQPGTYRGGGAGCYWARLGDVGGEDIITNYLGDGPTVVEIKSGDVAFETNDCDDWTLVN